MGTPETVAARVRELPPSDQEEVLHFVEFLKSRRERKKPYPSLRGACADLGIDITEEEFRQARKEMWGNFPREDI
jgi:hypothetical protein